MKNKERVFVVIPVHNRLTFSKICLSSLAQQKYKNLQVILVDAGSKDGTENFFRGSYPKWVYTKGRSNWWWTKSMAEGVKEALNTAIPGDFILTMNNDCYFKTNYISNMVHASTNNRRAIVGSLILDSENPNTVIDSGVRIDWSRALIYGLSTTVSNKLSFYQKRPLIKRLDTLPGKGTLVPIEVFKKVGNFNYKRLPHYIADYEFFIRAKRAGFNLLVSTKSRLYNYSRETGISHAKERRLGYAQAFQILFGRKSALNIVDHLNFLWLACPKKYFLTNLAIVFRKTANHFFRMFPFYYLDPAYSKFRLSIHNTPIYIAQSAERLSFFISKIRRTWKN